MMKSFFTPAPTGLAPEQLRPLVTLATLHFHELGHDAGGIQLMEQLGLPFHATNLIIE